MTKKTKPRKILIVGGGIAGLSAAILLSRQHGTEVTLIEKAPEFKNIGFTIALWGNGRKVLRQIGLDHTVTDKLGYEIPWDAFMDPSGKLLSAFSLEEFRKDGSPMVVIPRSDLHLALAAHLGPVTTRFSTSIKTLKNKARGVRVECTDGSADDFDLVIGADGTHSHVRDLAFGPNLMKFFGWSLWMFWQPKDFTPPRGGVGVINNGKLSITYPAQDRAVSFFITKKKIPASADRTAVLLEEFKDFGETAHMVKSLDDSKEIFFDDLKYVEMDEWYHKRVALIGDAQHAMSPLMGMGASLAMEDAFVLTDTLENESNIDRALEKFTTRRQSRIKKFQKASHWVNSWLLADGLKGYICNLISPFLPASFFLRPMSKLLSEEI